MGITEVKDLASLLGPVVVSTFVLGDLGDSEKGDLHTFQHTNNRHEEEEDNDSNSIRDTLPHSGVSVEESNQSDGEGKDQDTKRHEASSEEEDVLDIGAGAFTRLDRTSSKGSDDDLDKVRGVDKTGELNDHADNNSEVVGPGVEVVKHAVRGVDLRVELSAHGGEENHGKTGSQEGVEDSLRKAPELGIGNRSSRDVDGEHNEDNHKLTSEKVSVEGVAVCGHGSGLVGDGV